MLLTCIYIHTPSAREPALEASHNRAPQKRRRICPADFPFCSPVHRDSPCAGKFLCIISQRPFTIASLLLKQTRVPTSHCCPSGYWCRSHPCGACGTASRAGAQQAAQQQLEKRLTEQPQLSRSPAEVGPTADLPLETDLPRERLLLRRRPPPPSLSSITRTYAESKGFSNLVSSSFLQGGGDMHGAIELKRPAR